jgi:hypothetical protein
LGGKIEGANEEVHREIPSLLELEARNRIFSKIHGIRRSGTRGI